MGRLEKLYQRAPVPVQNTLISLYGLYWRQRRYGGIFKQQLAQFRQREGYSPEEWRHYQNRALRNLLLHAVGTVPHYTAAFKKRGIRESELRQFTVERLPELPVLTKEDLRRHGTGRLLSRHREPHSRFYPSSGSTGTPTKILFSTAMHQRWSAAFEARIRHWAGVNRHMPRGMIGGRRVVPGATDGPPYYRYNVFEKQTYFSAYHIAPHTVADYLAGMVSNKVAYMTGYAFSNYSLARFFKENNLQPPAMQAVITSSEKLTSDMRLLLAEVYRCRVYDSYSGLEACGLISECDHGRLHISPDVGILELVKADGTPAAPGEPGELLCTGLLNYDQPLIRYRIGDSITLAADQYCGCGRQMPVVADINGRTEDVIIGPDGREMVRFHGIFIDLPELQEAQLVQEAINRITVRAVAPDGLGQEARDTLVGRLHSQLGEVKVAIEVVDAIARGPNGKFRAVISKLKRN